MGPAKNETRPPSNSYTFELPYDNDLDQDELNRRLQKCEPGEVKRKEAASSKPAASEVESLGAAG
jgi:hypothetical protein